MSRKFDLIFRVRDSNVTGSIALTGIELKGSPENIEKAVRWFQRKGVRVDPVELNIIEG
jgi:hypothetical protein